MKLDLIFKQTRIGQHGKPFTLYKFRTMYPGAEFDQDKYRHLSIGIPPTFKIYNDPRLTPIGKFLYHTGLDELPQLWNIIKGDMAFIGPRPLPVLEAKKLSKKMRQIRESVKPGIISSWALDGSHSLSLDEWLELDQRDISHQKDWLYRLTIHAKLIRFLLRKILKPFI